MAVEIGVWCWRVAVVEIIVGVLCSWVWTTKFFFIEISQTSKIVSQMRICIDEYVVQFSVITKEWSSNLISLKDLLIGIVVMWFWFKHQIYFNLAEEWIEDLWNRITMNLWLCAYYKSFVLHVLHVFFIFEGLWWKFFGALEAWIRWATLICDLLRVLEAFGLDSSEF